jgi:hypothetical protein
MAFSGAIYTSVVALLAGALGGCSSGGASGGDSLDAALTHVADTAATRSQIAYDHTAELVRLSGTGLRTTPKGFGVLRGWGASPLAEFLAVLTGDTGISLLKGDYAITAGSPPRMVTLVSGGQSGSLVTSHLTKLGWKQNGGMLTAPPFNSGGSQKAAQYSLSLHVVRTTGSDVTVGGSGANLSQIGTPHGPTLASNPVVKALANCLGDVVAAQIGVGGNLGGGHPVAVAVGIRTPSSNTVTPHAIACVAWSSQAGATKYMADARKALSSGLSVATNQPFSVLLSHPSVTDLGGSQHIVEWQADTSSRADLIFAMYEQMDLPALPNCTRLPPSARTRVIGCT